MPAPLRTPGEAGYRSRLLSAATFLIAEPITSHDLTELFVSRQQLIEWFELAQSVRLKRSTDVFVDKRFEPIPQGARLGRDGIEFTGNHALPESLQHVIGYQSGLLEPCEKVFPRRKPLDLDIHRDGDGVQEIQSDVIGDEKRRRAFGYHGFFECSSPNSRSRLVTG